MVEWLGEVIKEVFDKDNFYSTTVKRFKVKVTLDKANIKRLKAILYEEKAWNRVINLDVDVWVVLAPIAILRLA